MNANAILLCHSGLVTHQVTVTIQRRRQGLMVTVGLGRRRRRRAVHACRAHSAASGELTAPDDQKEATACPAFPSGRPTLLGMNE
jgi:hypothetical protein